MLFYKKAMLLYYLKKKNMRGKLYKGTCSNTMPYLISHEISGCQSKFVPESINFMEWWNNLVHLVVILLFQNALYNILEILSCIKNDIISHH